MVRRPAAWRLGVVPRGVLSPGAVSSGAVLPCGAVPLGFPVLLPLLLVFAFAHTTIRTTAKSERKQTFLLFLKMKLDKTQHAHAGKLQNLCKGDVTYMLPTVFNGVVVVGLLFARG